MPAERVDTLTAFAAGFGNPAHSESLLKRVWPARLLPGGLNSYKYLQIYIYIYIFAGF